MFGLEGSLLCLGVMGQCSPGHCTFSRENFSFQGGLVVEVGFIPPVLCLN